MADETSTTAAPVDAPASAPTAAAPAEPVETNTTATNGDTAASKETGKGEGAAEAAADGDIAEEPAQSASAEPTAASTPAAGGKDKKRKSTGGVPEHKGKKAQGKRKSMPANLNLDAKPGQFFWARLKGYPPWPSVICDESMLPEVLLASRPVSTSRPDGTIREDFLEGGKNAKDRTYPIMFLSTNEFIWMNNTLLTPLDPEECKTLPNPKMTKALQSAYKIASENHDLDYFKELLSTWQTEVEAIRKAEAEADAEYERLQAEQAAQEDEAGGEAVAEKPKKKAARKSKGGDDATPDDAPKSTKKRKATEASEEEAPKAKKTPKVTKLNGPKTPSEASAKKEKKPKKKVVSAPKAEEPDETKPELTAEEKLQQREKSVLYLRHRLQKGFLSRDTAPQESEMDGMADFFNQLEAYAELEPSIIRTTKIHKVLKAIVKLASVPKDGEYNFKKRSSAMLEIWNKRMESENDNATSTVAGTSEATEAKAAETNGTSAGKDVEMKDVVEEAQEGADKKPEEQADEAAEKIEEKIEGKADAVADLPAAPTEKVADLAEAAKEEAAAPADADVNMEGAAA